MDEYHIKCLASVYKYRARGAKTCSETDVGVNHGTAFAELVSYIEEVRTDNPVQ